MKNVFRNIFMLGAFVLTLSACGGQLYKVVTPTKATPPPLAAQEQGFIAAAQVLTSDELMEQFGANLLLAGVVAVDVRMANRTSSPVVLTNLQWNLGDGGSNLFKLLPPKKALQQVMRFYGNRLYNPGAYQQTHADYEALAFPLTGTLEPQQEHRGFLFFATKYEATGFTNLTLTAQGQGEPLQLKLN